MQKMNKSSIIVLLFAFLLGCLVSGGILIFFATKAITKIQEGDMVAGSVMRTNYSQAVHNYEDAEQLWPFLQYNNTFISQLNAQKSILANILSKPSLTIYFKKDFSNTYVSNLTQTIQKISGVTKVKYVSQDDALSIYKQQNKNDSLLLKLVTADNLPASLEVYVSNNSVKDQIETIARNNPSVSTVVKSPNY